MKQTLRLRGELCPKTKPPISLIYFISTLFIILFVSCVCQAQQPDTQHLSGVVVSAADGRALEGANVKLKNSNTTTLTDKNGKFSLATNRGEGVLEISFLGYKTQRFPFINILKPVTISLEADEGMLEEVMVNTGYQEIPKERATGSFVQIDNELLNRRVGSNILDRLKGTVPGMLFDTRDKSERTIQIRGLYTLKSGNARPLIIVDNFPYEEDIENINPNDVESITVLKDAAAASIWGARAGNGVIVITTKKGQFNQPMELSFNVNTIVDVKPDLLQLPSMPTRDYIDLERFLFGHGYGFSDTLNYRKPAFSPVYEILFRSKRGEITDDEANAQIGTLQNRDVRTDYGKYLYRNALSRQYAVSLNGGTQNINYFFSVGYDNKLQHLKGNKNDRLSFRSDNTVKLSKNLQLQIGLLYANQHTEINSPGEYGSVHPNGEQLYPYAQLVDDQGNPAELDIYYRKLFTDTAGGGKLLDWKYRPLDELSQNDNTRKSQSWLADVGFKYNFLPSFSAEVKYRYQLNEDNSRYYYGENTFSTRDLINKFTEITDGNIAYAIPKGGILDLGNSNSEGHNIRGQLNFGHTWKGMHQLTAIAGAEMRQNRVSSNSYRTYGFDERLSFSSVNYQVLYPTYANVNGYQNIPDIGSFDEITDRYVSVYANAAYTFKGRYTLSGSARKDATNLFGVNANQRWKPLWSTGLSWNISDEDFYGLAGLPYLKVRLTYGYSGNVDRSVSSFTQIRYGAAVSQLTNIPFASIIGAPNPELRWEQVNTFNSAVDFGLKEGRIRGTVEYYRKKSLDVLGSEPLDPTTGVSSLVTNSANLKGDGVDLQLAVNLFKRASFGWHSNFQVSYANYKVTRYLLGDPSRQTGYTSDGAFIGKIEGYNPYALISYRWAGLDPDNGDPLGYVNGVPSSDYTTLVRASFEEQVVHSSALPRYFGSWLNTVNWKQFSLSANISFRLGHYFRRNTISYDVLYSKGASHMDYTRRWQKPGDEDFTTVPSLVYPAVQNRDRFYANSDITVEKADHIRLEDVRLSYDIQKKLLGQLPFRKLRLYTYITDLNLLIWKANKAGLDPEYPSGLRPSISIAAGIKVDF